jgi:UDP:flavonoid glycosyltransferase YjiC (YdhE family)
MTDVLIASVPIHGHVTPLLAVASGLVARGHRVRFLTGARFAASVRGTGATFVPLPAEADYDDRAMPQRPEHVKSGIAAIRYDVHTVFLVPALAQYRALRELTREPTDAVLVDPTFVGGMLLAGHPESERPPVIGAGMIPLGLDSRHVAPFGLGIPPMRGPLGLARNAVLRFVAEKVVFASIQKERDAVYRAVHGRDAVSSVFSGFSSLDAVVQFSVPAFEYPRPDVTVPVHFVGPMALPSKASLPPWWADLDADRPVVLVTQGTIANDDLSELVRPTLDALAGENVLVVATTGGTPVEALGALPANARAAEFLPYDRLLPKTDALVTNGGFGGIHFALERGVPIVIAGDTEDKPEVAARVAWSGVGVNLKTGHPKPAAIRDAVRAVLDRPQYRDRAGEAAAQIGRSGGVDEIVATIAGLGARWPARTARTAESAGAVDAVEGGERRA